MRVRFEQIAEGGRMKARVFALVALAVAVTLTSVAAAGPNAAKQRVAIDLKLYPQKTFVLTPLQAGPLKTDSGAISHNWLSIPGRDVMRDGQRVTIYDGGVATLTGKRGTLTIRNWNEWIDFGRDANGDGEDDGIGTGTWKVVRGTGQYAGIAGRGRGAQIGLGSPWYARFEGLLTAS
jgi:hypothetical protein